MVILLDAKQNFMLPIAKRYEFRWSAPDYLQWCRGKGAAAVDISLCLLGSSWTGSQVLLLCS